jgi:hypothetical protein
MTERIEQKSVKVAMYINEHGNISYTTLTAPTKERLEQDLTELYGPDWKGTKTLGARVAMCEIRVIEENDPYEKLLKALKNIAALEENLKQLHMSETLNPAVMSGAAARNAIRLAKEAIKEFENE